jgi:hypothetical protein
LILFASFVSDAHKVETHTRRRSTCGAKFLSDEEEAVSFTTDCRETFTKHGTCRNHERVPDEEEDLRQTLMQMRDMMKVMMGYMMSQGEGSNPSMHNGGGGDKNPGRNGGNGASPPPSPPPSSSHLLLLLLQVRRIFPILQRGMVKLLRKFLL